MHEFDFKPSEYMSKIIPNLTKTILSITLGLLAVTGSYAQDISTDEGVITAGQASFKANCSTCHEVHSVRIGPALAGVYERRDLDWLKSWIKNSQAMVAAGDPIAVELFEEYKTVMQAFPISDDEIMSILAYVQQETIAGPPVVVDGPGDNDNSTDEDSISSTYLISIIIILVVVLALALFALGLAARTLSKHLKEQKDLSEEDQELVGQSFDMMAFLKSNNFVGLVVFIFTILILKTLIDGAFTIGVQQGYQPTQPIAFSHEIHAGQYEIDCQYCHTGVNKSKSANIPSPNICMNCHTQVKTESEEIAKIYAAIDYDPATQTYGTNTKPIEWIRVHNLPDLAYFNHSQHVNVAEIECQTCHGPIEEMEVVYQYANLTMGWCINCHRETDVNTKGNEYYSKLVKLHSEQSKEPMKVEDIGGLECAKCHY